MHSRLRKLFVRRGNCMSLPTATFRHGFRDRSIGVDMLPNLNFRNTTLRVKDPVTPLRVCHSSRIPEIRCSFCAFGTKVISICACILPAFPLRTSQSCGLPRRAGSSAGCDIHVSSKSVSAPSASTVRCSRV